MLSLSVVTLINILIIAAGIGICTLCLLQISASVHIRKEARRYFQLFFALILFYITAHLAREIMNGMPGNGIRTALYIVTFFEMLSAGWMSFMMSLLVLTVANPERSRKPFFISLFVLLCVHTVLMAAGSFTDLVFVFDADNVYHRASGYLLSNLSPVLMLVIDMILLIRYRDRFHKQLKIAFWNYIIAPIVALAFQTLFYGVQFLILATIGAAVYMFGVILGRLNEQYEKQKSENSRIETELTMASSIQADMLPNIYPAFPDRPEFDIYASMDPAKEVGGDFYDFFLVDEDHLCMVMADVSGKGVPAALFMMASKIILANNAMLGKSPAQILTDTNAAVCSNNREELFVTVWLGILELSTGKLTAANAGHEYPALKHPDGPYELYKDRHGFVIGGMEGVKYKEYELQLKPGSRLFLYTDGVPEATSAEKELFGTDRMLAALNANSDTTPEHLLKGVRNAVDGFVRNAEQFDDLTMLCMEYKGPSARSQTPSDN